MFYYIDQPRTPSFPVGLAKTETSVLLSVWAFSWNLSLVFSKFWHGARNLYEVVHDRPEFSGNIFFAPKIGKVDQTSAKQQGFFSLLKNFLINFYWLCSIMKIYIICCFPAQIPYLGKLLFLR